LGWINTYLVLILPFVAPAFLIFLARPYILAGATLATVPVVAVFVFMQRQFIEGIMAGARKS
jgi:ABC-type glycerol-3-phosphate transport system permease component